MASITSLMNSNYNTNSIYGNRNVLSGLASGLDTETMIENAVSGIKKKIQGLYQKRTKIEWQQEAYRSIIDKAVNLGNRYTSYASKTNLLSNSFFTNAVLTSTNGTYASKVSATGRSSSNIKINAVKQLATAASYTVSGSAALGGDFSTVMGSKGVDLSADMDVSKISGSFTLQYGGSNGTSFNLSFGELDVYDNAEDLAEAIREKLGEQTWTYSKGGYQETVKGSDVVDVRVDEDGNIRFSDKTSDGNSVYINSASGALKDYLGVKPGSGEDILHVGDAKLSKTTSTRDYLSDKSLTFNLNGVSKTIKMSDILKNVDDLDLYENPTEEEVSAAKAQQREQFQAALQGELDKAFGTGKVKAGVDDDGVLSFEATEKGATLVLNGSAVEVLGYENGDANYINSTRTLKDLLGEDSALLANNRLRGTFNTSESAPIPKTTSSGVTYYVDDAGNRVDEYGYRVTDTDEPLYDFTINGAHIQVTGDTTLESLMNAINSNADAGVKVSYSKLTNEFKFTANETGSNSRIEFGGLAEGLFCPPSGSASDNFSEAYGLGEGDSQRVNFYVPGGNSSLTFDVSGKSIGDVVNDLNSVLFQGTDYEASYDERSGRIIATDKNTGETFDIRATSGNGSEGEAELKPKSVSSYTAGTDAVMDVEINGVRFENLIRSNNSFEIDGMTISVKDTFGVDENGALLTTDKDGNEIEPVTFTTVTDTDTIINAIRSFVNDYNEMVTELKGAYSTLPAQQTNGSRYEPLTAEQEDGMTESELAAYNEKAKQGLLFGDTTLSSMYSKLLNAIAPGGVDGQTLREIGISTSYENGLTTLSLNEDKLRTALENEPDKVKNAFTKTVEGGSSSDGLMRTLQNTLDTYVKTTGEPKGVLIAKAGSIKAPVSLTNNSLYTQIGNIDKQIQRWQDKMSSQIDRYTTQFSKLEQLIAQMNSQASALSGLMGGYEGY